MNYENWKKEYQKEVKTHLKENYRICYPYEKDYQKYTRSNGWVMVGTTAEFFRVGTSGKTEEITKKYDKILKEDINIFKGKAKDELERINPLSDDDEVLNNVLNYSNFKSLNYANLTGEQKEAYEQIKKDYIIKNRKYIDIKKDVDKRFGRF